VRDSLESDDIEDEAAAGRNKHTPPGSGSSSTGTADGMMATTAMAATSRSDHRTVSPLPAPKPTRPASLPRASLDGETIFAVGDETKWSDESDAEEREGLVRKSER
jgi:hypothetical protein